MLPQLHNLYEVAAPPPGHEAFSPLVSGAGFELERIASHRSASPVGFWYDQDRPEWVALLRGAATLQFESGTLSLSAGDCLTIPARQKHRVAATSADALWLALHFAPAP